MKVYCIFDDFGLEAKNILMNSGIDLVIHPFGVPRPNDAEMKQILQEYDGVILGTSQKISEDMFEEIDEPRFIATASVGVDHIHVPDEKKNLVTIYNTPKANAQSVAEYTMACALSCCKRLFEASELYLEGKDNKLLSQKPEDLRGKTIGVIGAGNISIRIMEYAIFFGMQVLCWTAHPDEHRTDVPNGVEFVSLNELVTCSDVISVNLPNNAGTKGIISSALIDMMKENTIFISVSRLPTIDVDALIKKAKTNMNFYVCLDIDVDADVVEKISDSPNVLITPHIGGGTIETRKRMFIEISEAIIHGLEKNFISPKKEI